MNDQHDPARQSEHEEQVAEEMERLDDNQTSGLGSVEAAAGETGSTPYEREIEIERTGKKPSDVEDEVAEDERNPLDAGHTGGRTG